MLQRKSRFPLVLLLAIFAGCDGQSSTTVSRPTTQQATTKPSHTVVSLSPAATDLILAMGAGGELVGVATYDSDPRVSTLPRVGDYLNVDWERIAAIAPSDLVLQVAPDRMPAGFQHRADALKLRVHNVKIDRFDDIPREAAAIGDAIGQIDAGKRLATSLVEPLDRLRAKLATQLKVRTLLALSEDGLTVAGPGTFLDDILVAAGGANVLDASHAGYLQIDRELLLTLAPDAVIQLAPSATDAQRAANQKTWTAMTTVPAVKNARVLIVTDPWALMPGSHMTDLAQRIATHLHPDAVKP